jgi:hypothetical protein
MNMKTIINSLKSNLRKYLVLAVSLIKRERTNRESKFIIDNIEKQFTMSVPNEAIFGVDDETFSGITYGEVRKVTDENKLIRLLKCRLDTFLFNQTETVTTPFPLVCMTCVAVETLGQIFFKENKDNSSFRFVSVINKFGQQFSKSFDKPFKEKLNNLWIENKEISKITTLGLLIYTYLRNTMIHGFQGRGVYLSFEDTTSFIKNPDGFLILNPKWFWSKTKDVYYDLYQTALKGQKNTPERINCLKYIDKLLR